MSEEATIPSGWTETTLGDIGEWYGGSTPSKFESKFWCNGDIPWVSPKDMKSFRILDSEDHVSSSALEETNLRPFPSGTILMVIRSGILSRTFPVAISDVTGTMNQDLKGVRPFEGIEPAFLAYQLIARERDLLRRCSKDGTTVASIDTGRLHSYRIRIAPTGEQRRIVAKIEELFSDLDAGVEALKRVRLNLKRYRAAVLNAAITGKLTEVWREEHPPIESGEQLLTRILLDRRKNWEVEQLRRCGGEGQSPLKEWKTRYKEPRTPTETSPASLPTGWTWATFDQVAYEVTVGHVGPMKDRYVSTGVPFLRSQNVRPLRFDSIGLQHIPAAFDADLKKSKLFGGELLVVRSGVNVGDACVFPNSGTPANCADLVICRPSKLFIPQYGAIFVVSPNGQRALQLRRTGNAQPHFNISAMQQTPFPLPPLEEQRHIVAEVGKRLSVIEAMEPELEQILRRTGRLRHAILKRAFEGKLVSQDSTEEPGHKLYERIRATVTASHRLAGQHRARSRRTGAASLGGY